MDAAVWNERYRSADRLWSPEPNLFVADRLGDLTSGEGIDLAAGDGRNSIWLAERGWSMIAVDFSEAAIEVGLALTDSVRFEVADVRQWAPDGEVDLALIAYLHLDRWTMERIVSEALGWLKPGGELFLIGHDRSNIDSGYGGPQSPEILWDVSETVGWLERAVVIEAQVVRRPVETDDGYVFARDTLVRAQAKGA